MKKNIFILLIIVFNGFNLIGKTVCHSDTCLIRVAEQIKYLYPDSAIKLCFQVVNETNKPYSILYRSYEIVGDAYWHKGDFVSSISNYKLGLKYAKKLKNPEKIAKGYSNLGYLFMEIGENDKAIEHLNKSAQIALQNNLDGHHYISMVYLALAWSNNKQYDKALEVQRTLLEKRLKTTDTISISIGMNNIAGTFLRSNQLDSALFYYKKALYLDEKIGNLKEVANNCMNISEINYDEGNYEDAFFYIMKAIPIHQERSSLGNLISAYATLAKIYAQKGDYNNATKYVELSLKMVPETNSKKMLASIYDQSSITFKTIGQIDSAFKYLELSSIMNDSIYIEETAEKIAQMETKLEFETKEKEIRLLNVDKTLQETIIQKQSFQKNMLIAIACLILVFSVFVFNRLNVTKKQKKVIEMQKKDVELAHSELEEKNEEIMDSIIYAKRIQSAILPSAKVVKEYLQESFILYKPKDIVAGDFYWMEHKNDKVLFAAADCTGHGVPGAMVSVVCNNALNRSVREHGLTDPGEILNKTREIVIQEFEKSDEDVQDGMDIALCSLEGNKLQYAGAHNPLWIIRKGELLETKANKQPIGQFDNPGPYTTHTFELQKGDAIYIFSDGYVDQFGGEKGKKFKAKAFRELLLSIQDKAMEEQKTIIDEAFETWRGNLEQIDDVCVIGVRV